MDIPLHALPSHNEPTQLCLWFVEQEHTKLRVGKLSPHSLTTEDWFHTLHDTQTVWKQTGHTTRPFIPVVDRGEWVYRDSHQKHQRWQREHSKADIRASTDTLAVQLHGRGHSSGQGNVHLGQTWQSWW